MKLIRQKTFTGISKVVSTSEEFIKNDPEKPGVLKKKTAKRVRLFE